jgi:hypothetical protein
MKEGDKYENFMDEADKKAKPFAMEQGPLKWSTIFVSLLIIGYGVYKVWSLNIDIVPGFLICLGLGGLILELCGLILLYIRHCWKQEIASLPNFLNISIIYPRFTCFIGIVSSLIIGICLYVD